MPQHGPGHVVEIRIGHVEPVEVAVEHEPHGAGLARRERLDRRQRLDVAIEASDHVKRICGDVGLTVEHARRVAVGDWAGPAGPQVRLFRVPGAQRLRFHASAPPQLEPWPAVHP